MKILFIVPSYKPAYIYGGTVVVNSQLAESLVNLGHQVTVYTTTANGKTELEVETGKEMFIDGVKVIYFPRVTKDHTHASPDFWRYLKKTAKFFDVVHIHSWWNFFVLGAAWICHRNNIKPVLSPHGMFSDYILETRNAKKKRLMHKLFGKKLLRNTFLHVSTEMEKEESKRLIPDWEAVVIPNLVELPDKTYERAANDVFTIGFLSRIDQKKGLELLIKALSGLSCPYKLLIAGSGENNYIRSLKDLSQSCGNDGNIEWVGWKNSEEKFAFLSKLDLFALTSFSENFAIVVIESLAVGTPVLISNQVGLYEYILKNDLGWVSENNLQQLTLKFNEIIADKLKLKKINKLAIEITRRDFDERVLTAQYIQYYKTVSER